MLVKTVKVSDKGQVSIPIDIRQLAGIDKGDELVITEKDGKIMLEKAEEVGKKMEDGFKDLLRHTEKVLARDWESPEEDEAWKDL